MDKVKKIQESRKMLIDFSLVARELRRQKGLDMTVNEILLKFVYDTDSAEEFNTFRQWKEKGYTIIKGSKAFLIWGQPTRGQRTDAKTEKKKKEENADADADEYEFFPLCYLFSDKQVHKVQIEDTPKAHQTEQVAEPEFIDF